VNSHDAGQPPWLDVAFFDPSLRNQGCLVSLESCILG
jgi:hypothetical protein